MREYSQLATDSELSWTDIYGEDFQSYLADELEEDTLDGYYVNYNNLLGICANCTDFIYEGQGGLTVHDWCANEFRRYLISETY